MNERELTNALQAHFHVNQEQEDALWARFQRRRSEAAAWGAFGAAMVLLNVRMRPACRASLWLSQLSLGRKGQ